MIKGRVRSKFIIGFLLIFIISSSILNLFIRKSIYRNRDRNIKNEKTILLNSSREFIKGVLENEVGDVSEKALIKSSYNIALKLSVLNNSYVAIHDKSGKLIEESNTNIARRAIEEDEDVKNALNNKAYYVLKNYDEKTINLFSYPLYINDNYIGIISFRQDYTTNYNEYNNLIKSISIIQMAAIIIAVLFSAVLIGRITKPLKMLTKKIDYMKNGNYNGEIVVKSNDELGILAKTFNEMREEIRIYIGNLKEEKDKVTKLEKAKQEFYNNITHELKTPLTGISSYAQNLEEGTDDVEFVNRAASRIKQESDRLHGLVLDLIEVSKGKSEIFEDKVDTNLKDIIEKVCIDLQKKADGYEAEFDLNIENSVIKGMNKKLQQLFINVLDNAVKYSVPNSKVNISIINKEKDVDIIIENVNETECIENTEELFKPFIKINSEERGSRGLGLNICRKIVAMHNGTIKILWSNYKVKTIITLPYK